MACRRFGYSGPMISPRPKDPGYELTEAQVAEVELARREVREGKIATEAEMAEVWRRFET